MCNSIGIPHTEQTSFKKRNQNIHKLAKSLLEYAQSHFVLNKDVRQFQYFGGNIIVIIALSWRTFFPSFFVKVRNLCIQCIAVYFKGVLHLLRQIGILCVLSQKKVTPFWNIYYASYRKLFKELKLKFK